MFFVLMALQPPVQFRHSGSSGGGRMGVHDRRATRVQRSRNASRVYPESHIRSALGRAVDERRPYLVLQEACLFDVGDDRVEAGQAVLRVRARERADVGIRGQPCGTQVDDRPRPLRSARDSLEARQAIGESRVQQLQLSLWFSVGGGFAGRVEQIPRPRLVLADVHRPLRGPASALTAVREAVGHHPATGRERSFLRLDLSVTVGLRAGRHE